MAAACCHCSSPAFAGFATPTGDKIVRMQTLNVRDILYILTGGSNTLALMRDEGVLLVDTKPAGWGRAILDNIESVTDQPVTTIINTHAHADHVGGNVEFPSATTIIAHANAKARMEKMDAFRGANAKALPNKVVTDRLSLLDGNDRIELYYFGRGHTDGDLVVVFPEKRLAHLGDLFPAKAAPFIDVENGGSARRARRHARQSGRRTEGRRAHRRRTRRGDRHDGTRRSVRDLCEPENHDAGRSPGVRRLQPGFPRGGEAGDGRRQERRRRGEKPAAAGTLQGLRHGQRPGERASDLPGVGK